MKIKNRSRILLIISAHFPRRHRDDLCGAGINYGIDFCGGSSYYDMKSVFDTKDVENAMKASRNGLWWYPSRATRARAQLRVSDKTTSSDESVQTAARRFGSNWPKITRDVVCVR